MFKRRSFAIAGTAAMTAVVALATLYLSVNTGTALFTFGDAAIMLTGAFFGPLSAAFAGGVGSFLADMAVFPATMWFTLVIKAAEGAIAGLGAVVARRLCKSRAAGWAVYVAFCALAGAWMVGAYCLTNALWWGSPEAAIANIPNDCVQAAVAVAVAAVVTPAADKALGGRFLGAGRISAKRGTDKTVDTRKDDVSR